MDDLALKGFLTEALVEAMDTKAADEQLAEYRFPMDRRPYTHQYAAWKQLKRDEPQSVLITSGTGSGKTEGFLVPILDDLARQCAESGRLGGVRALFLYPLNALINSQRDRLSAWSRPFNGDIRFCLYKGDTPRSMSAARRKRLGPELVGDRVTLREDPPPILVTNATMLEYMLIRAEDKPIIDQSQGMLRWIVLDEAHTYQGSRSAEIAAAAQACSLRFWRRAFPGPFRRHLRNDRRREPGERIQATAIPCRLGRSAERARSRGEG